MSVALIKNGDDDDNSMPLFQLITTVTEFNRVISHMRWTVVYTHFCL